MKTITYKELKTELDEMAREAFELHERQRIELLEKVGMTAMADKVKKIPPVKPLTVAQTMALSFVLLKPLIEGSRRPDTYKLSTSPSGSFLYAVSEYEPNYKIIRTSLSKFSNIEEYPLPTIDALNAINEFQSSHSDLPLYVYTPSVEAKDPLVLAEAPGRFYFVCMWGEEVSTPDEAVKMLEDFVNKKKIEMNV